MVFRKINIDEYFSVPDIYYENAVTVIQYYYYASQQKIAESLILQYVKKSDEKNESSPYYISSKQKQCLLSLIKAQHKEPILENNTLMKQALLICLLAFMGIIMRKRIIIIGKYIKQRLLSIIRILFAL